ncbi:hypothetical protein [Prosthecobacter sp.]|uniref:hypothetical protein n=1 Tax=Prosthecobacter sp. TaxID=1965333 RepID=UPI003784FAF5
MKTHTTNSCPSLVTVSTLPARVDSAMLAKFRRADEPLVVVKLVGVGNTAPYDFHDRGTRSYLFRYEAQMEGHILRVPLHLWQAGKGRLAHELMEQRRLPHAMVVLLESPAAAAPRSNDAEKRGATDTRADTRIVVGPGAEPTVAPASGGACGALTMAEGACGALTVAEGACGTLTMVDGGLPEVFQTTANHGKRLPTTANGAESAPLHEAAYALVDSPRRLRALAALLGEPEGALRAAIVHAGSRIELVNGGWVRRREEAGAA